MLLVFYIDRPFDPPGLGIRSSSRRFEGGFNRGICRGKVGRISEGTPLGGVHLHDQHRGGGRSKVTVTSKRTYVSKEPPIIRLYCALFACLLEVGRVAMYW